MPDATYLAKPPHPGGASTGNANPAWARARAGQLTETKVEDRMYGFVRAEHLNIWASRYTAPAEFPRLMRLLVWALVRAPRSVNFPADEAVRLAGYDGVVDVNESIGGIPTGSSVWALSPSWIQSILTWVFSQNAQTREWVKG